MINKIKISGAKVHNLKNINVEIPLNQIVAISGVSGSGKSSLALGVLYSEGSRRYLESLSTYTRRRMTQASKAQVDEILHIPASIALHQRPGVPSIRSTFGTGTELLNSIRLMFSRLASHCCPNGHYLNPTMLVAEGQELVCPECGIHFMPLGAEDFAFNSRGACECCGGTGIVRTIDESTLIADDSLTIQQGAVAPWNNLMWSIMIDVCKAMGVRIDVPYRELSDKEKDIVLNGPAIKKHIFHTSEKSNNAVELDFTYYNAKYTVENALAKVKDETGMKKVSKYLKEDICPKCHGTRFSENARKPKLCGLSIDEVCKMPLSKLIDWVKNIPNEMSNEMKTLAESICESFLTVAKRLIDLGLGYLSLDRTSSTLSTGERQRMQLARTVRNRSTGILYVLDEPSIGLHPSNIVGLTDVMKDLINDGNSVVLVDHDVQILKEANWMIELGPGAGSKGGYIIGEGTIEDIEANPNSKIGKFLAGENITSRKQVGRDEMFNLGEIKIETKKIHTVKPLSIKIPKGRLTVVTGVSGSGKTTLILESLVPALQSKINNKKLPEHVKNIQCDTINQVKLIDATPIGINIRSTIATYANVHDELRKIFANTDDAKKYGYVSGDFSYNTGKLRCPTCDGTGVINLDIQFLPDVEIVCPDCKGTKYCSDVEKVKYKNKNGDEYSLSELMKMDIEDVITVTKDLKVINERLKVLQKLGLGYLTLGEETPKLSGGEAQRLKLASEIGRKQYDSVFVFDEPTVGLHPLDVKNLIDIFDILIDNGATVIVIEHDLDVIKSADYIIDMGPGGGEDGGQVVAFGTPQDIMNNANSITGKFLTKRIDK